MNTNALLERVVIRARSGGQAPESIGGIQHDSRRVMPGDVFVARRGIQVDGHAYIEAAVEGGASLLVVEDPPQDGINVANIPWVQVEDADRAMAEMAANLYERPTEAMDVIGFTGTNGKTTSAFLAEGAFQACGRVTGMLGTVTQRWPGHESSTEMTTPDAITLQGDCRGMRDAGVDTMLIEVSSHAIVQRRCDSVEFDVAAFTNLGRDHLDYHGTIEEYTDVKKRLFNELLSANENARGAVVNVDDPVGEEIAAEHRGRVLRYGTSGRALDLYAEEVREDIDGISATVVSDWGRAPVRTSLAGEHNLRNILAALGCGLLLDMPLDSLVDGIAAIASVPGRLERVGETEEFCVFVDYAHTHDALEAVLQSLRPLTRGRLITVFGCGGDRDTSKRALMGEVAARYSDVLIVTSDNPRSENPLAIIHDVEAGLTEISPFGEHNERGYILEVDRADAIRRAVGIAHGGDVVLIAGKGHETYQEIGSERLPFDDRAIAGAAIAEAKEGRR